MNAWAKYLNHLANSVAPRQLQQGRLALSGGWSPELHQRTCSFEVQELLPHSFGQAPRSTLRVIDADCGPDGITGNKLQRTATVSFSLRPIVEPERMGLSEHRSVLAPVEAGRGGAYSVASVPSRRTRTSACPRRGGGASSASSTRRSRCPGPAWRAADPHRGSTRRAGCRAAR